MTLQEYAKRWLEVHPQKSDIYGDAIENDVIEIVDLLVKQKHSGVTLSVVISIVVRLLKDYTNR